LASHWSAPAGTVFAIQWLRFFLAGGLITPAMWPEAPSTKRFLPDSSRVEA
jgi:hypothetical protein